MLSDCRALSCFGSRLFEEGDGDVGGSNGRVTEGAEVGDGVGGTSTGAAGVAVGLVVAAAAAAAEIRRRSEKIAAGGGGGFIVAQRDVGASELKHSS